MAPTARADTSQFHIIHPVWRWVGGKNTYPWPSLLLPCLSLQCTYSAIVKDDIVGIHVAMENMFLQMLN